MKIVKVRILKIAGIILGSGIIAFVSIIVLISPITKYLIEKYDEKYTGRQITLDWLYVNPFTGYIHIRNLLIYESKNLPSYREGDSIFFSAKGLSANFSMRKLRSKIIEIKDLDLVEPTGNIVQSVNYFNFSDLIKRFTPHKQDTTLSKIRFNILGITIHKGRLNYNEKLTPINYFIKEINAVSTGKPYKIDTVATKFDFLSGTGSGAIKGNITINLKNKDFRLAAILKKLDLKFLEQYLKDLSNYGSFMANLDADIKAAGNFTEPENLNASGLLAINNFHYGINQYEDFASFDKLVLYIEKLSPNKHIYLFDSVSLRNPYFKYESYDYLDNLQTMFGKKGSNISQAVDDPQRINVILKIAHYIRILAKNFFLSDYKVNKLAIINGKLRFNDFSKMEKFSIEANPLNVYADSINKHRKRVTISFQSGVKPYGNISVLLKINPKDSSDFDMQYALQKLPVSMFNPYLISYTSFPVDRGTIEINGKWRVRKGFIKSDNHLLVIDPRIGTRQKSKSAKWLPMPLINFFIRDRGNVFDYDIPITGNLRNPRFHLKNVFWGILGNIFSTPATIPYKTKVTRAENEIEKFLTLKWETRQFRLLRKQERFIKKMVVFLRKHPKASMAIYPMQYTEKERESILFFEAKKKYYLKAKASKDGSLSLDDSLKIEIMSVKDPVFVKYMDKHTRNNMLFTIQEKCMTFIGPSIINTKYIKLNSERKASFLSAFKEGAVENRVKIHQAESTVPYNGFSFYKIVYEGDIPNSLIRAHEKMNDLNNEAPRKDYEKKRKKIFGVF